MNVWLYVLPDADVAAVAQFMSFGEQKVSSAVQLAPLVTVCPVDCHCHCTVSPT